MRWLISLRSKVGRVIPRHTGNDNNLRAKPKHSLSKNIHAIVLTLAFAVAIAGFTASGAVAQATKLVFEERATDSKVTKEFETNGRIEIDWRADA